MKLKTLRDYLVKMEEYLLFALMTAMTVITFAQVIFRFVFQSPLSWSEELARYLFVWTTFIGASIAIKRWSHFQVDLFVNLLPAGVRAWANILGEILILVFSAIMIYYGLIVVQFTSLQLSPALQMNMAIAYFALPLSGILIALHTLERIFDRKEYGKGGCKC